MQRQAKADRFGPPPPTSICSALRGNKGAGALLKDLSVITDVLAGRRDLC